MSDDTTEQATSTADTTNSSISGNTGFSLSVTRGAQSVADHEDAGTLIHLRDHRGELMYYDEGGETKPVTLRMAGTYSNVYRRALAAQRDKMLKQRRNGLSGDQLYQQQLDITAACAIAWTGIFNSGQPFPCTKANAAQVFDAAPWIREQAEEVMGDHESFFSTSSPN